MADPCPGREAFVVQRSKPGTFPAVQMTVALDQLNIEVTSQLPKIDESDKYRLYNRHRRVVTVTGSAES